VISLAIAAALAFAAAAGTLGLWWGERGRRIAMQHMLTHGTPDRPTAKVLQGREDADVEDAREVRQHEISGILAVLEEEQRMAGTRHTPEELQAEAQRLHAALAT